MKEFCHVFPYDKVEKGSRIIIYGAGNVGGEYLLQLQLTEYCNVLFVVDRDYIYKIDLLGVAVLAPISILSTEYDYVVIAMAEAPESLLSDLHTLALPESKVIYPTKLRIPAYEVFPEKKANLKWRTLISSDTDVLKALKSTLLIDEMQQNSIIRNNDIRKYLTERLRDRKLIVYGIGDEAAKFAEYFSLTGIDCDYFIDDDFTGNEFAGKEVRSSIDIVYEDTDDIFVLIANENEDYATSRDKLISLGLAEDIDFTYYLEIRSSQNHPPYLFDVTLSFNRVKESVEGFELIGDFDSPASLKIVALGGSTTDSEIFYVKGWVYYLSELLQQNGISAAIYCGGVCGYNSTQELLKLIRDVLPLNPDIVLSYSGLNDLFTQPKPEETERYRKPFITTFQTEFFSKLRQSISGSTVSEKNIYYGLENDKSAADVWIDNTRAMSAIAKEFDVQFMSFFQPYMFDERYNITDSQAIILNRRAPTTTKEVRSKESFDEFVDNTVPKLLAEYNNIRERIKDYDYIFDLSGIFMEYKNIYIDSVHVYDKGNEIIAESIFDILLPRLKGMLSK